MQGVVQIPLTRGLFAIIDEPDLPLVRDVLWYPNEAKSGVIYAIAKIRGRSVHLQNLILPPAPGYFVDHKNFNALDNRRDDLLGTLPPTSPRDQPG